MPMAMQIPIAYYQGSLRCASRQASNEGRNILPELELLLELLPSEPEEAELDESESDVLSELSLSCLRLFRGAGAFSVLAS